MSTPEGAPGADDYGFEPAHQFQSQAGLTDFGERPPADLEPPATSGSPEQPPASAPSAPAAPPSAPPLPEPTQPPQQPGQQAGHPQLPLDQVLGEMGLSPEQAQAALREYMYLAGPEGQQQFEQQIAARVEAQLEERRSKLATEGMRALLTTPEGRARLYTALVQSGGVPGYQQSAGDPNDPSQPQQQGPPAWAMQLQQEVARVRTANEQLMQQLNGREQAQVATQAQQGQAAEFDAFIQRTPDAARIQDLIAADVAERVRANPQAYGRPGAVAHAAQMAYQRYRASLARFGTPPNVPPGAPPSGGGGLVQRPQVPRGEGDLVRSILQDINTFKGGDR